MSELNIYCEIEIDRKKSNSKKIGHKEEGKLSILPSMIENEVIFMVDRVDKKNMYSLCIPDKDLLYIKNWIDAYFKLKEAKL